MSRYKELLKMAKASAQSWGKTELFETLQELDSIRSQIYDSTQVENWAINANVHFNEWTNFSESDFRPVVEAYRDLWALFSCSKCGVLLRLTEKGNTLENIRCDCEKISWNLLKKKG